MYIGPLLDVEHQQPFVELSFLGGGEKGANEILVPPAGGWPSPANNSSLI